MPAPAPEKVKLTLVALRVVKSKGFEPLKVIVDVAPEPVAPFSGASG